MAAIAVHGKEVVAKDAVVKVAAEAAVAVCAAKDLARTRRLPHARCARAPLTPTKSQYRHWRLVTSVLFLSVA